MTVPVRSEARTPSPVGEVFDLLTSERWVERKAARFRDGSRVVRREVLPDGGLLLAVSRELPDGAPGYLTRLLPDGRVLQTDEWAPDDGSGTRTGTWKVELAGAPARLGGTMRIEPDGTGSAYAVLGETKVSVPLVGGKAESFIAEMVRKLGRTEGDLLRTTLAQTGTS
jgi:hypothetical protein